MGRKRCVLARTSKATGELATSGGCGYFVNRETGNAVCQDMIFITQ